MKKNKTSKLAIRIEPREKKMLDYFATRLGMSSSALVRNQIKLLLSELEEKINDAHYVSVTSINALAGPTYSQNEIEQLFEVNS